jgi:NAD(P)-dependent dehydrogenase (short-subunit alcohol dehydrogenase family)
MKNLDNTIAVVTGASRGGGRGIARVLGERGATVYVTARSTLGHPGAPDSTGSIEESADEVSAAGGKGIPVRCDHANDDEVEALFRTVRADHGRLDLLVCNAWGGYQPYEEHMHWGEQPFWQQSMARWEGMFTAGLRSHLVTCLHAIPLMLDSPGSLVVMTTFTQGTRYLGNVFYDVAKNAICRAAYGLGEDLRDHDVAVVALSPGWMLVERMKDLPPRARAQTESVDYLGRAVAALVSDPTVIRRTGRTYTVGGLAREYGFTDLDGRQPTPYIVEN